MVSNIQNKYFISVYALLVMALATSKCSLAKEIQVAKNANLPVSIRTSVPRSAKTWFIGKIPSEFRKPETWLHFYSTSTHRHATSSDADTSVEFNPNDYVFNIWQRVSSPRKARFRRLNSVSLSGAKFLQGIPFHTHPSLISSEASLLWLRKSTKQTPVIRLNFNVRNDVNSNTYGVDVLIIFRNGFQNLPTTQQFVNFNELLEAAQHDYNQTDEQGILMIKRQSWKSKAMDADRTRNETFFRWNGQTFSSDNSSNSLENR
jgi:hypothetical protein